MCVHSHSPFASVGFYFEERGGSVSNAILLHAGHAHAIATKRCDHACCITRQQKVIIHLFFFSKLICEIVTGG